MPTPTLEMESILANIWLCIQAQLTAETDLKFIDLDTGQLEYKDREERPSVLLPCALIDFPDVDYESLSFNVQEGEAVLQVRLGVNPLTQATQYFTDTQKANALNYFNLEGRVNKLLHGWSNSQYFTPLRRIKLKTEGRNDKLRVRVLFYKFGFVDDTAIPITTSLSRPDFDLNITDQGTGIGS